MAPGSCTGISIITIRASNVKGKMESSAAKEISELWKEYVAAATAGDLERWINLWTEDGIQMPPDAPRRVGRALIRAEMKPLFDLFNTRMAIYPDETQVSRDQAFTHGLYEVAMTPKEGGDSLEFKGKFLTILRKQADDSWKIAIDCFNHDTPQ